MRGLDRQSAFIALVLLITALFVASGLPQASRWSRPLRLAAIVGFALAVAAAIAYIAVWLSSGPR